MSARYVKILYYDGTVQKQPLGRHDDLATILRARTSVVGHSVRWRWWYLPFAWLTPRPAGVHPDRKGREAL